MLVVSAGTYPFPVTYHRMSWLQVSKLLLIHPRLQFISRTFLKCLPMIAQMLFIGFAFMYAFSVVGFELFHTSVTGPRPLCGENENVKGVALPGATLTSHPQDFACIPKDFNFEAVGPAFLSLFQVVVSNNWNDLLFPNIDATSRYNALYFASFFILTNFILVNLMTSLILDVYEYRMRQTKSDKMFDIRYEMPNGSTQIWTILKNRPWRVAGSEVDSQHQELLDRQLEQSIEALEVRRRWVLGLRAHCGGRLRLTRCARMCRLAEGDRRAPGERHCRTSITFVTTSRDDHRTGGTSLCSSNDRCAFPDVVSLLLGHLGQDGDVGSVALGGRLERELGALEQCEE